MLAGGLSARLRATPRPGLVYQEWAFPRGEIEAQGGASQFWTLRAMSLEAARWTLGAFNTGCHTSCTLEGYRPNGWLTGTGLYQNTMIDLPAAEREVYIGGLTLDTAVGILDSG